ncbi:uncharacterized protein PHACADRAFT_253135 [Phanerochaete carnosa HHB-10118-sp]|uniref:Uncharacterized protein n=1 Tax=Phanerochaete carnosa (strain HHB-10118-sp) TaxID=650164 RepID=K5WHQ5_PHACS|nr:uncharacterized protein PHACADRAFT_253135 [Phanerochaete carnosa HHB-10118-sp]EKM58654.1 hypothetical protein PHACADRAFT_253135 [Phanerochaete carnosa HHB-10118-sp]
MHISVQAARFIPPDGGNETWSVHQIALADSKDSEESHRYLYRRNWSTVASLLSSFPQLQLFQISCGAQVSEMNYLTLSNKVTRAVNNHPAVKVRHNPTMPDGRFLQPALFSIPEKDLAAWKAKVCTENVNVTDSH